MRFILLAFTVLMTGCNSDRLAKLEKENGELRQKLESRQHADLATQEKCSTIARTFMNREYSNDGVTILLRQTNHYDVKAGRCFVLIEWHYSPSKDSGNWYNRISLHDPVEGIEFGKVFVLHQPSDSADSTGKVYHCEVGDVKCTSVETFMTAVSKYMRD